MKNHRQRASRRHQAIHRHRASRRNQAIHRHRAKERKTLTAAVTEKYLIQIKQEMVIYEQNI